MKETTPSGSSTLALLNKPHSVALRKKQAMPQLTLMPLSPSSSLMLLRCHQCLAPFLIVQPTHQLFGMHVPYTCHHELHVEVKEAENTGFTETTFEPRPTLLHRSSSKIPGAFVEITILPSLASCLSPDGCPFLLCMGKTQPIYSSESWLALQGRANQILHFSPNLTSYFLDPVI